MLTGSRLKVCHQKLQPCMDRHISWHYPPTGLRHVQLWGRLGRGDIHLTDHNVDLLALNTSLLCAESPLTAVAMTVLLSSGRTLSKTLLPRSGPLLTRLASSHPTLRVSVVNGRETSSQSSQAAATQSTSFSLPIRTYATVQNKPVGRPKAHTGRTTAKRTTTRSTTAKKAAPKKAAKKPAAKKAKAKAKPKPKAKPKKREPTAASLARQEKKERTELKKRALLTGAPKQLPATAWAVCFTENGPKKGEMVDRSGTAAKRAAQVYRNVSLEEREVCSTLLSWPPSAALV